MTWVRQEKPNLIGLQIQIYAVKPVIFGLTMVRHKKKSYIFGMIVSEVLEIQFYNVQGQSPFYNTKAYEQLQTKCCILDKFAEELSIFIQGISYI